MFNRVESTFPAPFPRSEARALVEAFARQKKQRVFPLELQDFPLGARFRSADPQARRVIVMAMLAWLDGHSLKSYGRQDQHAWQRVWKMREAFLHLLQFSIPFHEEDIIAMLNWSASQSSAAAYVYFSGVPQVIRVVGDYLRHKPMTEELHAAIEGLVRSIESASMSVEVRRWILRLKELMGEAQVSLPLVAGDAWADTALKEIYAMNSREKTAWAGLLTHCSRATAATPSKKWLAEADSYVEAIGDLYLFIKLSHWFPLVDRPLTSSVNATVLKGLVWLCSKSEDLDIAFKLSALAVSSLKPGSAARMAGVGHACCWALANMPVQEGQAQLRILKEKIRGRSAQRVVEKSLQAAVKR